MFVVAAEIPEVLDGFEEKEGLLTGLLVGGTRSRVEDVSNTSICRLASSKPSGLAILELIRMAGRRKVTQVQLIPFKLISVNCFSFQLCSCSFRSW